MNVSGTASSPGEKWPQRQKKIWEKEEKGKKDGRKKKGLRKNGFILFSQAFYSIQI